MKTLVISAITAMTSLVNAASSMVGNRANNFAYNTETIGNRVETQEVFKVENRKFLQRHLKYNYLYDAQGRISRKEVLKWNEKSNDWNLTADYRFTDEAAELLAEK